MNNNKINDVIQKMINNTNLISNIIYTDDEYFFIYKSKYKWGIKKANNNYYLYYYSDKGASLESISKIEDWESYKAFTVFNVSGNNYPDASLYSTLYEKIKEKYLGIDAAFDDILNN